MKNDYGVQVNEGHYTNSVYLSKARWSTYALIIEETLQIKPKSIIEIGPGPGVVSTTLRKMGFLVKTLDMDPSLHPDYLLSATDDDIASKVESADLVIASEIFEHVKYEDFLRACINLRDITHRMILTLPDTNEKSLSLGARFRFPLLNKIVFMWKIRFAKTFHKFNGEHYWEIGKRGYSKTKIVNDLRKAGWITEKSFLNIDNPYHRFFFLKKTSI